MSEMSDRDRGRSGPPGGRRRRPRGGGGSSQHDRHVRVERDRDRDRDRERKAERDYESEKPPAPARPPIILAKHSGGDQPQQPGGRSMSQSTSPTPLARQPEKPVMVLKPREEGSRSLSAGSSLPSIPAATTQGEVPQPGYHLQRPPASQQHGDERTKSVIPPDMKGCVKLIDDIGQWSETASESLLDQTDFLVVGVIGLQGTGKSTVLSLVAGNTDEDSAKSYIFPPQTRDTKEKCAHQTNGIDIFVTPQRILLLDSQPVLSPSVLEFMIRNEKKLPPEYTMAENCNEIQCLQQAAFLMTVCHVILVVEDWFTDMSLLRFLLSAEMLKPSTLSGSHGSGSGQDDMHEFFPHLVFIQNKAGRDDFSLESYESMQKTLEAIFNGSRLKISGAVNMSTGRQMMGLNPKFVSSDMNLFLLPYMDDKDNRKNEDTVLTMLPEYRGYPSFSTLINSLRSQIFSLPRETLTHTSLSEKNWFHFAARTWDAIKKSQLIAEYNRLLP